MSNGSFIESLAGDLSYIGEDASVSTDMADMVVRSKLPIQDKQVTSTAQAETDPIKIANNAKIQETTDALNNAQPGDDWRSLMRDQISAKDNATKYSIDKAALQKAVSDSIDAGDEEDKSPATLSDVPNYVKSNALMNYMDTSYHISLSMVKAPLGLDSYNTGIDVFESTPRICFASSADTSVGTVSNTEKLLVKRRAPKPLVVPPTADVESAKAKLDSLKPGDDYRSAMQDYEAAVANNTKANVFKAALATDTTGVGEMAPPDSVFFINELNFRTVTGNTSANPEIANTVEISMKLSEPHGFSLDRNIRQLAPTLGYKNVSPIRIVWRIEVYWSGFDSATGEWTPRISFSNPKTGKPTSSVVYFCHMMTMDTKVESSGTTYNCSFVPTGMAAARPEVLTINSKHLGHDSTFGGFCTALANELNTASENLAKANGGYPLKSKYQIVVSDECKKLWTEKVNVDQVLSDKNLVSKDPGGETMIHVGRDYSILEIIRNVLDSVPYVHDEMIRPNDKQRVENRVIYVVKPDINYNNAKMIPNSNDYDDVTYIFKIEKIYDWRLETQNTSNLTDQQYINKRLKTMIASGALKRIYDYAFTPTNAEVFNVDVELKVYWYENIIDPFASSSVIQGIHDARDEQTKTDNRQDISQENDKKNADEWEKNADSGKATKSAATPAQTQDSKITHQRYLIKNMPDAMSGQVPNPDKKRMHYDLNFERRLIGDLIELKDMKVLGDPGWLFTSYSMGAGVYGASPCPVIRLNVIQPDQSEYMSASTSARAKDTSLGGFYEIVQVDHKFVDGMFTQNLTGYRLVALGLEDGSLN